MWIKLATFVTLIIECARGQTGAGTAASAGRANAAGAAGAANAAQLASAAAMGSDFAALGPVGLAAFSGGGMPPAMAYKMFDGSLADFQKHKAKMSLMKSLGGGGGGGGARGGGLAGTLAMGKLAAFTGGGMDPLMAYKMFDGSVSDFQKHKLRMKLMGGGGAAGGGGMSSALALNALDGSVADMAKLNALQSMLGSGQSRGTGAGGMAKAGGGGRGRGLMANSALGKLGQMKMNNNLCEDTPVMYRMRRCSAKLPCPNPMTKCTQSFKYGQVCCAKDFMAVRMFENMPGV